MTERRAAKRAAAATSSRAAARGTRRAPGEPALRSPGLRSRAGAEGGSVVGLALAGGGPLGAVYEIGALVALSEALDGVDLNRLDIYVGVSAGSFLAASLANGLTPAQVWHMFVESDQAEEPFAPELLVRPALGEYARRLASVPGLLLESAWDYLRHPLSRGLCASFQRLSRALPTGLFSNHAVDAYMAQMFSAPGRSNDFRRLPHRLFLVATDLDSGEPVAFGGPGSEHVPISTAVRASAALPGLYPPVEIDGRHFVDGALRKTLHASVALREGAHLVLCINPIVPFDSALAARRGPPRKHNLVEGGLPVVLSQTFRSIIHSRMRVGMDRYAAEYADRDVILFEPARDDADMFFTNVFSYANRRRLSEHAYRRTRAELLRRRAELEPILARHGIRLRLDVLRDERRRLAPEALPSAPGSGWSATAARLNASLDDLQRLLSQRKILKTAG